MESESKLFIVPKKSPPLTSNKKKDTFKFDL